MLNETGLACKDIEYPDALSGTQVIIDDTVC